MSGECPMCGREVEDTIHFLVRCDAVNDIRVKYFGLLQSELPHFKDINEYNKAAILLDINNIVCGVGDTFDKHVVEEICRLFIYRIHCRRTWFLNNKAPK